MNSPDKDLAALFRRRGVLAAQDIAATLNVSQPTVSRLIAGIGSSRIVRMGKARSSRYALRRPVRGIGSAWPLYRISTDGAPETIGRLYALEGGQWYVEQGTPWDSLRGVEFPDGLYPGLPWFLQDLRPRGFLGRSFARCFATQLGVPTDPQRWSEDDIAVTLIQRGENLAGDLVVGETALTATQMAKARKATAININDRPAVYPAMASATVSGDWPGSSAAGEQPKFTVCLSDSAGAVHHAIVKFSGNGSRPEDQRWADLLVAEDVANGVLSEQGVPCASTQILQSAGRFFLESTRFDRLGEHGRRGLVSLEALDAAFFGALDTPWTDAATRLLADGWLTAEDSARLSLLWRFGSLIGNTDMHYGNASLFLDHARPLALAPTYDMVPMLYRPDSEGHCTTNPIVPPPPLPEGRDLWLQAEGLAETFWTRLASSDLASANFRNLAARNADAVAESKRRTL
jgi:hypothetical protein